MVYGVISCLGDANLNIWMFFLAVESSDTRSSDHSKPRYCQVTKLCEYKAFIIIIVVVVVPSSSSPGPPQGAGLVHVQYVFMVQLYRALQQLHLPWVFGEGALGAECYWLNLWHVIFSYSIKIRAHFRSNTCSSSSVSFLTDSFMLSWNVILGFVFIDTLR